MFMQNEVVLGKRLPMCIVLDAERNEKKFVSQSFVIQPPEKLVILL